MKSTATVVRVQVETLRYELETSFLNLLYLIVILEWIIHHLNNIRATK